MSYLQKNTVFALFAGLALAVATAAEPAPPTVPKANACSLVPQQEIEKIVGEPLKETKPSNPSTTPYDVEQCYFAMKTPVNSVVLTVVRRGQGAGALDPKEFWAETFHKDNDVDTKEEEEKKRDENKNQKKPEQKKEQREGRRGEEEEEKAKPVEVNGIGDEAFWTGNAIGGALFVLKGNVYLRVSAGGAGDQDAKIKRCKAVVQVALANLK
jgi:hypothetical protein